MPLKFISQFALICFACLAHTSTAARISPPSMRTPSIRQLAAHAASGSLSRKGALVGALPASHPVVFGNFSYHFDVCFSTLHSTE